jgi:hypothetical protein
LLSVDHHVFGQRCPEGFVDDRRMRPQLEGKVAAPDPSRVLVACETFVLGSTVGPHLRRVNVFVKVLDRHLEAASLSRIRSKAMMDRASKYFELLGVMTMCRPCSTGGAATEKECSRDQGPPPHPGNVATAAGVSLATVSRCLTTEQMSRPRHAHGCSGYWSSTTMCHLAHQWSASSAGGRRLIPWYSLPWTARTQSRSCEGSRRALWMSWSSMPDPSDSRPGQVDSPPPDGPGPSSSLPH